MRLPKILVLIIRRSGDALDSYRDPAITDSGRQTMQAMVSCVSEGTGNVTRALKKAGMWDTTLFLWSSDNGGPQYWLGNNYPLRGGKGASGARPSAARQLR